MNNTEPRSLLSLSVDQFLDELAAKQPSPGGGAAAGLCAATVVATTRMVLAYSSSKLQDPSHEQQLQDASARLARLDQRCRRLIDEDAEAYNAFSETSRRVKNNEAKPDALQAATQLAAAVPLELLATTLSVLRLLNEVKTLTAPALRSDLAASAQFAMSACRAAEKFVRINAGLFESEADRAETLATGKKMLDESATLADEISSFVSE